MTNLIVGNRLPHMADHGRYFEASAAAGSHIVPGIWGEPRRPDRAKGAHVLLTGLLGTKESMEGPIEEVTRMGNFALAIDFTNNSPARGAIDKNVEDAAAAVEAIPDEIPVYLAGLSMGGLVAYKTAAKPEIRQRLTSATGIAAPGLTDRPISFHHGAIRLTWGMAPETAFFALRHMGLAAHLLGASTVHMARRGSGIVGEIRDLTGGITAHSDIAAIQDAHDRPHLRSTWGESDRLIPARPQAEGIKRLGFDSSWAYRGGHLEFLNNPGLIRKILWQDKSLEPRLLINPLPSSAKKAA